MCGHGTSNFHQTEKTPEILISGREAAYFRSHFFEVGLADKAAVNEAKLRRYAAGYAAPAQLRAGLGCYRATRENAEFNRTHNEPIRLPLTLVGGKQGVGPLCSTRVRTRWPNLSNSARRKRRRIEGRRNTAGCIKETRSDKIFKC
jgi:hypothetical protein